MSQFTEEEIRVCVEEAKAWGKRVAAHARSTWSIKQCVKHGIEVIYHASFTDSEALAAFHYLCRTEGIIPALESSHAVAYAMKLARTLRPDQTILVNLSGRGDKDIGTVADLSGVDFYDRPSMRGLQVKGGKA